MINFFFITNSVELAVFALASGADRIFVDLEFIGKLERQSHLDTLISRHTVGDVAALRPFVPPGALHVRINALHENSFDEINDVIAAGADTIMLPMFRTAAQVELFVRMVGGRARTSLLVETLGAAGCLKECVAVRGVDEVHIGLNDLHLELDNDFMFEPLANGLVDVMAAVLNEACVPFGIGGVARVGEGLLPAELILSEHARLGSNAAILSRTFHRQVVSVEEIREQMDFGAEIKKLRLAYDKHCHATDEQLEHSRQLVNVKIRQIAAMIAARKSATCQPPAALNA